MDEIVSPVAASPCEHMSNSCAHEIHSECPGVCTYCETTCRCECHVEGTMANVITRSSFGGAENERRRAGVPPQVSEILCRELRRRVTRP